MTGYQAGEQGGVGIDPADTDGADPVAKNLPGVSGKGNFGEDNEAKGEDVEVADSADDKTLPASDDGDSDDCTRSETASEPLASISSTEDRMDWKTAVALVQKINLVKRATAVVQPENKIGTRAEDLPTVGGSGDGILKMVGLSVQRAFRDFGRARVAEGGGADVLTSPNTDAGAGAGSGNENVPEIGVGLEGFPLTPDEMKFGAEEEDSSYVVRQPAFVCRRVHDSEFSKVRSAFGITEQQYYAVFGLQDGRRESNLYVIGSDDASGKSQSFFFLTPDQRFILKSCTPTDVETLTNIAKRYREYVESQQNPAPLDDGEGKKMPSSTLLPRCLGLYSLEFDDAEISPIFMVAMTNFFGGAHQIHVKYDLKGSTHGRSASASERSKKSPVFKDLDWLEEGRKLRFPSRLEMERVMSQLSRDTAFLSAEGLIDYSLLVGLHEMDESEAEAWRYGGSKTETVRVVRAKSEKDMTIAYYGIVDVLTPYGFLKGAETFFTGTLMGFRDVSCQPPEPYRRRFLDFCEREVLACDGDESGRRRESVIEWGQISANPCCYC